MSKSSFSRPGRVNYLPKTWPRLAATLIRTGILFERPERVQIEIGNCMTTFLVSD